MERKQSKDEEAHAAKRNGRQEESKYDDEDGEEQLGMLTRRTAEKRLRDSASSSPKQVESK